MARPHSPFAFAGSTLPAGGEGGRTRVDTGGHPSPSAPGPAPGASRGSGCAARTEALRGCSSLDLPGGLRARPVFREALS